MSKADKMFKELGYTLNEETNYSKELSKGIYLDIDFTDDFKQYVKTHKIGWEVYQRDIFLDEHLAIHEKMKEAGWLNE